MNGHGSLNDMYNETQYELRIQELKKENRSLRREIQRAKALLPGDSQSPMVGTEPSGVAAALHQLIGEQASLQGEEERQLASVKRELEEKETLIAKQTNDYIEIREELKFIQGFKISLQNELDETREELFRQETIANKGKETNAQLQVKIQLLKENEAKINSKLDKIRCKIKLHEHEVSTQKEKNETAQAEIQQLNAKQSEKDQLLAIQRKETTFKLQEAMKEAEREIRNLQKRLFRSEEQHGNIKHLVDLLGDEIELKNKHICFLERNLGDDWEELSHELDFTPAVVDAIRNDHGDRLTRMAYRMLHMWQERMGRGASLKKIMLALIAIDRCYLAQRLYDFCEGVESSSTSAAFENYYGRRTGREPMSPGGGSMSTFTMESPRGIIANGYEEHPMLPTTNTGRSNGGNTLISRYQESKVKVPFTGCSLRSKTESLPSNFPSEHDDREDIVRLPPNGCNRTFPSRPDFKIMTAPELICDHDHASIASDDDVDTDSSSWTPRNQKNKSVGERNDKGSKRYKTSTNTDVATSIDTRSHDGAISCSFKASKSHFCIVQ